MTQIRIKIILSCILLLLLSAVGNSQTEDKNLLPGTIFFNTETYMEFDDLLYIHGSIAPTSRFNKYKSIKILHENSIRVISVGIIKYLRIDQYKIEMSQLGNQVLRDASIRIETKSRQTLDMPYYELEWILVKVKDPVTGILTEQKIVFVENGKLTIKKILLD